MEGVAPSSTTTTAPATAPSSTPQKQGADPSTSKISSGAQGSDTRPEVRAGNKPRSLTDALSSPAAAPAAQQSSPPATAAPVVDRVRALNLSQETKDRLEAVQCIDGEKGYCTLGDRSEHVKVLQTLINEHRRSTGKPEIEVNGNFDEAMLAAVKEFQADKGLKVDGKFGPRTWRAASGVLGESHRDLFGFRQLTEAEFLELTRGVDSDGQGSGRVVPFSHHGGNPNGTVAQYRINQRYSWDCGPTAHAAAFAPFLGVDPETLATRFRAMQGGGGMSWANPKKFADEAGMVCINLGNASPQKLAEYKEKGYAITGSFNDIITNGGHITALGSTIRDKDGRLLGFENHDPNAKNIAKGLGQLTAEEVERGGRQFWAFRPKSSVADSQPVGVSGDDRITFYGYSGDTYSDSLTSAGHCSLGENKLRNHDLALSRDVEAKVRAAGGKLGDMIELTSSSGQTFVARWSDRTAREVKGQPITNRFDICTQEGKGVGVPFRDGERIVSFRVIPPGERGSS